jgi:hypothetical protein
LLEERSDVDALVPGRERTEPPRCLLELALTPRPIAAPGLVPGDDDVDQSLEEVLLGGVGGPPSVLERLVGLEVLAPPSEFEP